MKIGHGGSKGHKPKASYLQIGSSCEAQAVWDIDKILGIGYDGDAVMEWSNPSFSVGFPFLSFPLSFSFFSFDMHASFFFLFLMLFLFG